MVGRVDVSWAAPVASTADAAASNFRIDLTREPPFHLGDARVRPATCEVAVGDRRIVLQHRVMQVLVALARSDGEVVSRDSLVASCWDGLAVGDDAINRCVQRLRRLAEREAPGAYVIETLPRIGYRLKSGAAPDRIDGPHPRAVATPSTPRRLVALIAAAVTTAVLVVAWAVMGPRVGPPAGDPVIAVMPFRTAGHDPAEQAFAAGVAENVAYALTKADLRTLNLEENLPTNSADRGALAEQLGARLVLDGLVDRSNGRLILDVRIDDLRGRSLLWSAQFDRPDAEAQPMQQQVAARVAWAAHCALRARGSDGAQVDDQSVGLYLKACDLRQNPGNEARVHELLEQVVAREPQFAGAWGALAKADTDAIARGAFPADQQPAVVIEARTAARKALAISPRNADAYAALIDLAPKAGNWMARGAQIEQALRLAPDDPDLLDRKGAFLASVGRPDEGVDYALKAMDLDPLSVDRAVSASQALAGADQIASARNLIERAARTWPDNSEIWWWRLSLLARLGSPDEALAFLDHDPGRPADAYDAQVNMWRELIGLRKAHDPARIAAYVRRRLAMNSQGARVDISVLNLSTIGANEAALQAATLARPGNPLETEILFRPTAAGMRRDPRFLSVAARFGLVSYWRSSRQWPDFCRGPSRPYDCQSVAAKLGV